MIGKDDETIEISERIYKGTKHERLKGREKQSKEINERLQEMNELKAKQHEEDK